MKLGDGRREVELETFGGLVLGLRLHLVLVRVLGQDVADSRRLAGARVFAGRLGRRRRRGSRQQRIVEVNPRQDAVEDRKNHRQRLKSRQNKTRMLVTAASP